MNSLWKISNPFSIDPFLLLILEELMRMSFKINYENSFSTRVNEFNRKIIY